MALEQFLLSALYYTKVSARTTFYLLGKKKKPGSYGTQNITSAGSDVKIGFQVRNRIPT